MFCPNCGTRVEAGVSVCPTCSTNLAPHLAQMPPPPPPPPPPSSLAPSSPSSMAGSPPPPPLAPAGAFPPRSKIVAGLLQIFLGAFGAGRFYTGHTGIAIGQIAAVWLTCGIGWIWPIIDGILMLAGQVSDSNGRPLQD